MAETYLPPGDDGYTDPPAGSEPPDELTEAEREALLVRCTCGHTINDHGSLVACWTCDDEGDDCETPFESLLVERVKGLVDGRVAAALEGAREDVAGAIEAEVARVEEHPVRNTQTMDVTGYMLTADIWRSIRSQLRIAARLGVHGPTTEER